MNLADLVLKMKDGGRLKIYGDEDEFLFASFCLHNSYMSFSQRLQDLWVLYELGKMPSRGPSWPGFFIDFGAGDGRNSSNSYLFQKKFGWWGISVEPNTDYDDQLKHNSTERVKTITGVAIGPETGEMEFVASFDPSLSTLNYTIDSDGHGMTRKELPSETRKIPVWSLNELCQRMLAPVTIDYLSIDTEGSEFDILKSWFEKQHSKIYCITVEHNFSSKREDIFRLLTANDYVRRFPNFSGFDDWYIHKSVFRTEKFI